MVRIFGHQVSLEIFFWQYQDFDEFFDFSKSALVNGQVVSFFINFFLFLGGGGSLVVNVCFIFARP